MTISEHWGRLPGTCNQDSTDEQIARIHMRPFALVSFENLVPAFSQSASVRMTPSILLQLPG